jgi:hypothetical protein
MSETREGVLPFQISPTAILGGGHFKPAQKETRIPKKDLQSRGTMTGFTSRRRLVRVRA